MSNSDTSDRTSIAALVIAVVAFLTTIAQLVQSIIAAARGLPNCSRHVMGRWADSTSRHFRWSQFRLEIYFESPVLLLAPVANKKFPVKGVASFYANGTDESWVDFRLSEPVKPPHHPPTRQGTFSKMMEQANNMAIGAAKAAERIHNVDNERVTWLALLETVQKMENVCSLWEKEQAGGKDGFKVEYDLVVWMQPKKHSFDANPTHKKPYANTTICHIIELAAMLGIHWKQFDRDEGKYRAEGNGSSLLGTRVDELGVVFVFERTGQPVFEGNRVIPTTALKEVAFGNVPTIFRPIEKDDELRQRPINEQDELYTLQLGSVQEIAQTLDLIGCNTATRLYYLREQRHIHLFPVTFEVLGMLGRTLHLPGRPLTYLPNPSIFEWNRQSFSMRRMLKQFASSLATSTESFPQPIPIELHQIQQLATNLLTTLPPRERDLLPLSYLTELHSTLDAIDAILLAKDRTVVLDVLRRHLQEVLLAINTEASADDDGAASAALRDASSFDNLLDVPPEKREREFMTQYFDQIRHRVVATEGGELPRDDASRQASREIQARQASSSSPPAGSVRAGAAAVEPGPGAGAAPQPQQQQQQVPPRTRDGAERNTIWCALVLRMICWLLLHNFDRNDVQLPKSGLMGNRQPVYIM